MEDAAKLRQSQPEPLPLLSYFALQLHSNICSLFIFWIGLFFLTVNVVVAVICSHDDPPTIILVVAVYILLLLLFLCVHLLNGLPDGSTEKERLKIPVWFLTTSINIIFAWRFSSVIPLPFAFFGWGLAVLTGVLGFYFLFLYKEEQPDLEAACDCEKLYAPVYTV